MAASVQSSSELDLSSIGDGIDEEPLGDLTDEELFELVQKTMRANEILKIETKMFESHLKRVDPKDLTDQNAGSIQSVPDPVATKTFRKRSRSRGHSIDRNLKLSAEQKCDIATRELEELRESIDKMKEVAEKKLDNFKAIMEEADIRHSEVKKTQYEFKRDVVNGAVNPRNGRVIAEKLVRSVEDKLRSRDTLIEKLRLKNSTLKVLKKKLQLQLKQKEEMGEVLHEVDFNQLKIENSQYLEKIDERNQDLLRLKLMATNVLQILNTYKKKLSSLTMESDRLNSEITMRKDLFSKIEAEMKLVDEEKSTAEEVNRKCKTQLQDFKVPEVMEYVHEKAELYELRKAVSSWERKVEITSMALKTHLKTWQKLKGRDQYLPEQTISSSPLTS
ncbi:cilia- and flagella-associated protein 263-like [Clytia hemisphaerica]|uniref:Cilia- and flagella-associated protein 263 n=1 Tax=Clytia hemisphaerica TaxID=252671 RepID=A0A7M5US05_9CNID